MSDDGADEEADALPASMADMFFALVAIVIFMLLALAPALQRPADFAAPPQDLWQSDITIAGAPATTIVADAEGLRLGGEDARRVGLDRILDDPELSAFLDEARSGGSPLLLAIEEEGQEASFLFDAAASARGITDVRQVRIEPGCGEILVAGLRERCRRSGLAARLGP